MSGPDYRQAEEAEQEQWEREHLEENRLERLEVEARAEQEDKFCRELEAQYPILKGWK